MFPWIFPKFYHFLLRISWWKMWTCEEGVRNIGPIPKASGDDPPSSRPVVTGRHPPMAPWPGANCSAANLGLSTPETKGDRRWVKCGFNNVGSYFLESWKHKTTSGWHQLTQQRSWVTDLQRRKLWVNTFTTAGSGAPEGEIYFTTVVGTNCQPFWDNCHGYSSPQLRSQVQYLLANCYTLLWNLSHL